MEICSPLARSRVERPWMASDTALRICCLKRRMKRWRLTALLFLLSKRRSMMRTMFPPCALPRGGPGAQSCRARPTASRRLAHAQVPLAQQAHLLLGVTLVDHAIDEGLVLLLLVGAGLGVEADHRQQVFGVGEHLLLDHRAQLLVR